MPTGHYGTAEIGGKRYQILFWSSLKSQCQREARWHRREEGSYARVIRHPIQHGTLTGGSISEEWCVAVRGPAIHRKIEMKKQKEQRKR
jgi:hypothetical protein